MIKLNKSQKPLELTDDFIKEQTEIFKLTGKSVWNLDFIKKRLLECSSNKCCYCETNISEESKYLEVEHFYPKDIYPDEVLDWDNLLPSCKKCNGTKNSHDTKLEPIINPIKINPKNHLRLQTYRLKGKDDLGKLTISVLDLNNQDRIVQKRFEIANAIQEKLEDLNELMDDYISGIQNNTRRKNRVVNGIKDLMREGLPSADYAATAATAILNDSEFNFLKAKLQSISFWDNELIQLESDITKVAM